MRLILRKEMWICLKMCLLTFIFTRKMWGNALGHIKKKIWMPQADGKISIILWNCSSFFYHPEKNTWSEPAIIGHVSIEAENQEA